MYHDLKDLLKPSRNIIITCAQLAEEAHRGQVRKYHGRPYIEHPMRVANRVMMLDGVPEAIVGAAWLHDAIEDCQHMPTEWWTKFPGEVYDLVEMLTNPSKKHPELRRAERKKMDREHYHDAPDWIKAVKLVDRTDNLQDMAGDGTEDDFVQLYLEESRLLIEVLTTGAAWQNNHIRTLYHEYNEAVKMLSNESLKYRTT